jgi:hypothetical protein
VQQRAGSLQAPVATPAAHAQASGQTSAAPQNAPSTDHIHTIYRDPTNDYGGSGRAAQ